MLAYFYRLSNDMTVAVQNNHFGAHILYRTLEPSKKRRLKIHEKKLKNTKIFFFRFPIGSIDQLEDSLRRVQDANEVPYENRIAIQYKTTTQPFSIVTNNIFFVLIGGWLLYGRAKRGVNPMGGGMGVQMGGGAKPTGKGKKGKKGRRDEPANPFNPMGNTTKSTAQVIDPEVKKRGYFLQQNFCFFTPKIMFFTPNFEM